MDDCVFCRIVNGSKKEKIVYRDGDIIVFLDKNPRTKIHLLITPKKHYVDFYDLMKSEPEMLTKIGNVVKKMVEEFNIGSKAYTWGFHCGGKQSVNHVHAQLLAVVGTDQLVL
jgi:histidine triad (HIT) family protein